MPVPVCTAELCPRVAHASPEVTVRPQTPEGFLGRQIPFPEKLQPHRKLPRAVAGIACCRHPRVPRSHVAWPTGGTQCRLQAGVRISAMA